MINYVGIDIFSGAGGMSIGATNAGIDVKIAVEIDKYAAYTYKKNHFDTKVYNKDIREINFENESICSDKSTVKILFGGPPCKGFSTSNQKNRNKENSNNWLFKEYLRVAKFIRPDWIIVENVKGIVETENGYFFEEIQKGLKELGYNTSYSILNAADYGIPQIRNRVFVVGSLHGISYKFPTSDVKRYVSVNDALSDLPSLNNGANFQELDYKSTPQNTYQTLLRENSLKSVNNNVTRNNDIVLKRYNHIPQGGNWQNIPSNLMSNYKDHSRCHTGIYHRLKGDSPSIVLGNYRKNMLIHPTEDRGLSVREAARLQSFPDTFHFYGSIGFQQEQVGNSVPPILAKAIFNQILTY
ncbi:DNA cytosine methyltransferase [Spirosoma rhododendri]|uniref:Cytosine-specific methyltransferase n=1 Tax=Spirosoma rhododendri TaxID=2728024 RepID=A0A7L5DTG0_9BACT|nr:DNA cytosine methyltransferase [Spirosoma rhododendri]QJD81696.1 DNA cytosine methyltransferase [Spirosoma rhododendri]